ncbi:MAG: cytochrome c [Planctomycetes bacterium]|nr:cytochrome c [Planctomycetota bacterium]
MRLQPALLALTAFALAPLARADEPARGPTFHRDVEPILQQRCQVCHRPDGVGPFPLLTHDDVAADLPTIAQVVADRRMPPWHADPAVGTFSNSRALSDAERSTLLAWIEAGGPKGDPKDAPKPREWVSDWVHGEPDAVVQTPGPFKVPARGTLDYQYFRVATDFGEDKWIRAMEVRVDAPTVVHHVLVFVQYPRAAGASPRVRGGLDGYFASALPGDQVVPFPAGSAKRLPRGSTLVFQVHYTPDGEVRQDRTRLGLYFAAPDEVQREAQTVALNSTGFAIPPGVKGHEVRARYQFDKDTMLVGLTPHMHLRGESFRYLLLLPDGTHRPVLSIPRYDFNWQTTYRLAEPMFVPKGARMMGIATFDNSAGNPANPDPTRTVYFGEQTTDEMMIGYMDVVPATAAERAAWEAATQGASSPLDLPPADGK